MGELAEVRKTREESQNTPSTEKNVEMYGLIQTMFMMQQTAFLRQLVSKSKGKSQSLVQPGTE